MVCSFGGWLVDFAKFVSFCLNYCVCFVLLTLSLQAQELTDLRKRARTFVYLFVRVCFVPSFLFVFDRERHKSKNEEQNQRDRNQREDEEEGMSERSGADRFDFRRSDGQRGNC